MKSGSLLDYYRYETDGVDDNASESKSFRYKTNIIEEMQGQPPQSGNAKSTDWTAQPLVVFLNVEVTIPTKYISNFWMSLIKIGLSWRKYCAWIEHHIAQQK